MAEMSIGKDFMQLKSKDAVLRKARADDRARVAVVEAGATPKLRYLPVVYDQFLADRTGEFMVAEIDRAVVGCGKFSLMPDGSAWLESLRVLPEYQGLGLGKRMYERFFELARQKKASALRMYTGLNNAVSKGLAERFGFKTAATYRGAWLECGRVEPSPRSFGTVTSPERAAALMMPLKEKWTGFLVMNRTFYALTPALCAHLARQGMVYEDSANGGLVVAGARFMPEQALHLGLFKGDAAACLALALQLGGQAGAGRVSCLFPPGAGDIQDTLLASGYQLEVSDFIVMEVWV